MLAAATIRDIEVEINITTGALPTTFTLTHSHSLDATAFRAFIKKMLVSVAPLLALAALAISPVQAAMEDMIEKVGRG
jgi:hypothetical protein